METMRKMTYSCTPTCSAPKNPSCCNCTLSSSFEFFKLKFSWNKKQTFFSDSFIDVMYTLNHSNMQVALNELVFTHGWRRSLYKYFIVPLSVTEYVFLSLSSAVPYFESLSICDLRPAYTFPVLKVAQRLVQAPKQMNT